MKFSTTTKTKKFISTLKDIQNFKILIKVTFILYLIFITCLSLIPVNYFIESSLYFEGIDKMVHILFYVIFSFLLFIVLDDYLKSVVYEILLAFIVSFCYGVVIEILQLEIKSLSRSFEWFDIISDCIGALIGVALAKIFWFSLKEKFLIHK